MKSTLKERIFSSFFFKEIHENNCSVEKRIRGSDTCKILYSLNLLAMLPGTLTCSNKNIVYFITFQLQIHIAHIKTGRIRCWVPNHLVILQTNQAV